MRTKVRIQSTSGGAVATESGGAVATESGGAVATESGGAVATESGGVATAGDETVATDDVVSMDEGELEFDEDEMAALERFWSCYAVIPLAGLSRISVGRWRPWAYHATNHNIFIYQPIFTIFAAKNSAISRL